MSPTQSWTSHVLQAPHFREEIINHSRFDRFRLIFDRSRLLDRAIATCTSLNTQAGMMLIRSETFSGTYPIVGRYSIEEENIEMTMELAVLSEGPTVIFSSKAVRPWVKRIQRYCGLESKEKIDVTCRLLIDPAVVTDFELQQWFNYLLSGLHDSFKPQPMEPFLMNSWMGAVCPTPSYAK
jgi:hypothetical protein